MRWLGQAASFDPQPGGCYRVEVIPGNIASGAFVIEAGDEVARQQRTIGAMPRTVVTPNPGFISIAVSDAQRSAAFYEEYLGAIRNTFDFGPDAMAFVGWPTFAVSSARRAGSPGPSPETTIQLWWRASDAQALYETAVEAGIGILLEPFDGPIRPNLRHGRPGRVPHHDLREGPAPVLAAQMELTRRRSCGGGHRPCVRQSRLITTGGQPRRAPVPGTR